MRNYAEPIRNISSGQAIDSSSIIVRNSHGGKMSMSGKECAPKENPGEAEPTNIAISRPADCYYSLFLVRSTPAHSRHEYPMWRFALQRQIPEMFGPSG
jgi:hypothetical protein